MLTMDKGRVNEIDKLGELLVKCDLNCESVSGGNNEDKTKGIIPRCINLEPRGDNDKGVIVVGINPGRCNNKEKEDYLTNSLTYAAHKEFMRKHILPKGKNIYHDKTRDIWFKSIYVEICKNYNFSSFLTSRAYLCAR